MQIPKLTAFLVFDGIQVLDVTGPAAVFAAANDAAGHTVYDVRLLSATGGPVRSNSGVVLFSEALSCVDPTLVDTLLISGGDDDAVVAAAAAPATAAWIMAVAEGARRIGSICSGALGLGSLGLLDGKRATTHWSACTSLAQRCANVQVDPDAVYIEDGRTWTSAGVTTGIDMSLQLVARDLGESIANAIAKRLVIAARRPGYQAQLSPVITAQEKADPDFAELIRWIKAHLSKPLDVAALAERVVMSPRTFHRKFSMRFGQTPARFVETLRLDHGHSLLATGLPAKFIAAECGYGSVDQFKKAYRRHFGRPAAYLPPTCA